MASISLTWFPVLYCIVFNMQETPGSSTRGEMSEIMSQMRKSNEKWSDENTRKEPSVQSQRADELKMLYVALQRVQQPNRPE